ncbi:MAG: EamA family transporter [Acidobacteria bacterium]|nr:EamA family transporter [Acidobacteriota bacterium]
MITAAAVLWGGSATAAKFLFNRNVDTLLLVQLRVTLSFLALGVLLLAANREALRLDLKLAGRLALLGILGIAGSNFFYYYAIKQTNVATAIVMQYTAPVLVMFYSVTIGKEVVRWNAMSALALSVLGCFLVVAGRDASVIAVHRVGIGAGLLAALSYAFFTIYGRSLSRDRSIWRNLFYTLGFTSLFWFMLNPPWRWVQGLSGYDWLVFSVFALGSILLPYLFYLGGLKELPASRAIITATLEPVMAILSAMIFVGERTGPIQVVGVVLVIGSVLLLQVRREPARALDQEARKERS